MSQSSSHSQARGVDAGVWSVLEEVRRVPRRRRSGVLLSFKMTVKTMQCWLVPVSGTWLIINHT